MSNIQERIDRFLAGKRFAVVGASRDRAKYGNKVLRAYLQQGRDVVAVNPREQEIEGVPCYADIASLPEPVDGISVITPPKVTESIIAQAAAAGIEHVWLQPGAESEPAISRAENAGMNLIPGDACVLVILGFRDA
jgi:predicted CoA-binding protein